MTPDLPPLRVLDALPQLVWATDPDGAVTYVNARFAEYTGIPADDLLGWDWKWVVHPDDLPATLARWAAAVRDWRPHAAEHRLRRADGQYRWFLTRAEPAREPHGRPVGWVGTSTDTDDASRERADARGGRRLVRAFVDRADGGHALVGADRVVRYASPWVASFLGRPPSGVEGTDAWDWVHRDDRPRLAEAAGDLLARPGERVAVGARLRHADGSSRRVRLTATNLLPDPDVRAVAVVVQVDGAGP